jgi:hypothetical protein
VTLVKSESNQGLVASVPRPERLCKGGEEGEEAVERERDTHTQCSVAVFEDLFFSQI